MLGLLRSRSAGWGFGCLHELRKTSGYYFPSTFEKNLYWTQFIWNDFGTNLERLLIKEDNDSLDQNEEKFCDKINVG